MSKGPHNKLRRAARTAAVQALYQLDMGDELSGTVIKQFVEHRFENEGEKDLARKDLVTVDEEFFQEIVEGVIEYQAEIDASISSKLSAKWKLERLDLTLRAILRAAGFEIRRRPDVPALVIIDQYVSIAADFFEGKEPGFINGALDKMAKDVRKAEFGLVGEANTTNG